MAKESIYSIRDESSDAVDWLLIVVTMLLCGMGLLSIYSATYDSNMSGTFFKQLASFGVGIAVMFVIYFIPERLLKLASYVAYGGSILLLVLVLIIGSEIFGTKGWINLGFFNLQPAELAKIGVIFMLAGHLSIKGSDIRTIRDLFICIIMTAVPAALILLQPDTGSATVLLAMLVGVLFWTGFDSFTLFFLIGAPVIIICSLKGFGFYIASVAAASAALFMFRRKIIITLIAVLIYVGMGYSAPLVYKNLQPHQQARIETFLNPGSNPRGAGYNVMQSLLAVGSGGLTGKGYLQGTQTQLRYIPMQWTDFIFSVPNEEFGFVGGALVILLYAALLFRCVKIASEVDSKFYSIIAIGFSAILIYHVAINIGMAIGIMPVMGIPLPFMSYGGTSMVVNLTFIGLLLNAHKNYKIKHLV